MEKFGLYHIKKDGRSTMNPTTGELQNISLKKNPVSDYVLNVADAQQLVHQPVFTRFSLRELNILNQTW